MIVRKRTDTDGECFAVAPKYDFENGCKAIADKHELTGCGTYECPFYKPYGCEEWIRIERGGNIYMFEPEEAKRGGIDVNA